MCMVRIVPSIPRKALTELPSVNLPLCEKSPADRRARSKRDTKAGWAESQRRNATNAADPAGGKTTTRGMSSRHRAGWRQNDVIEIVNLRPCRARGNLKLARRVRRRGDALAKLRDAVAQIAQLPFEVFETLLCFG